MMNTIERDMVKGMVSILNEAKDKYYKGCPIISDEQYDVRLKDLKQLEEETGYILLNSPTMNMDLKSITLESEVFEPKFKELNDTKDIVENFDQKEVVAHAYLNGTNTILKYANGVITEIETENVEYLNKTYNIPYKINREDVYCVYGKIVCVDDKLKFFVDDIIDGVDNSINKGFKRAEELGFDVVPNWFAASLNPKMLQGTIDYVFDYMDEENLSYDGIIFRVDDIRSANIIKFKNEGSN